MFNPFFSTKSAGEGTGVGLSLSHDIVVKQHGGTCRNGAWRFYPISDPIAARRRRGVG
jgi:nitrogen-specific signal transduction histidine kinase